MSARPRDILLIVTDQQRQGWLGCEGAAWARTPHLDRLAAAGTRFTGCCTNAPVCAPARCALATGLAPHRCGVLGNHHDLDPAFPTLYRHLRDRGWWTGYVGKLDLAKATGDQGVGEDGRMPALYAWGFCDPRDSGGTMKPSAGDRRPYFRHLERRGRLAAFDADRAARNPRPGVCCAMRGEQVDPAALPEDWIRRGAGDSLLEEEDHTDGFCGELAERWLEEACARRDPFFLQVNFHGPHDPYDPPAAWADRFRAAPVPEAVPPADPAPAWHARRMASAHRPSIAWARRQYAACLAMLDHRIGRLLELLERRGRLASTLVAMTSDHGDMLGDLGFFTKSVPYEGALRVPLLIAGPGLPAGRVSDAPVELADLHPTLCELAGVPVPAGLDARSLAPLLDGRADGHREDCLTMLDSFACLRAPGWKYLRRADGGEELYDLERDPGERHELLRQGAGGERAALARCRLAARLGPDPGRHQAAWWAAARQHA